MSRPVTIGLTGGMASGKSTVARLLAEADFLVVDADRLVAELYQSGGQGAAVVQELFGDEYLRPDGSVEPTQVAKKIFGDDTARKQLEERIHPLVRQRFANLAAEASTAAVLEATLLVEAGYQPDFDLIVTVEADESTRLARALGRGMELDAARARLRAQGTGAERIEAADILLINEGTLKELEHKVAQLVNQIEELARQ